MDSKRIDFIGRGVMGAPMARNLAAAGHAVTVFDTDTRRAHAAAASGSGLEVAKSLREIAGRADIVITMLAHGDVAQRRRN